MCLSFLHQWLIPCKQNLRLNVSELSFFPQRAIKLFCKHSIIFRWENDTQVFIDYNTERDDSAGTGKSVQFKK